MGMVEKSQESIANTAFGKKLDTPIKYSYKWSEYETAQDVRAANDWLSDEEVVKTRNNERLAKARSNALNAALDAAGIVKPTLENDEQLRLREMFKVLMSNKKYTEDQAREIASTTLGIAWAE